MAEVAVTGIGLVTPFGNCADAVLEGIRQNRSAAIPSPFPSPCPVYAPVQEFDASHYFPENKTLRLMNRDATNGSCGGPFGDGRCRTRAGCVISSGRNRPVWSNRLDGSLPAEEITRLVESAAAADGFARLEPFRPDRVETHSTGVVVQDFSQYAHLFCLDSQESSRSERGLHAVGIARRSGHHGRHRRGGQRRRSVRGGRRVRRKNACFCVCRVASIRHFRCLAERARVHARRRGGVFGSRKPGTWPLVAAHASMPRFALVLFSRRRRTSPHASSRLPTAMRHSHKPSKRQFARRGWDGSETIFPKRHLGNLFAAARRRSGGVGGEACLAIDG